MNAPTPSWLVPPGADPRRINELLLEAGPLPPSYLQCLRRGNGGEVGLRVSPLNLCLDSAEAALDYWRSGTYTTQQVFVFGSSGGGDLLAFDLRTPGEWPVVCYDPIDPDGSMERVASSFELLLELCEGA
ncbi:MAG: hypothetical protein JWP22_1732 [Ramlibacter sp.]|nr:hypothetical protein [Ramlibacter sp.]